ncbi:hypothetical protein HPB49_000389 [Dermacentor silvarum]|uniref:Uncharacterized protein n=1 Tax=Dermacentor silvarum TaxID=543639 RepID=A0ACB8C1V8_DERSI|nr:hypothetical protein HPB49_000389 [Dermacentor silvarum]
MVCQECLRPAAPVALQNTGAVLFLILAGAFVDCVGRRALLLGSAAAVVTCTVCTFAATDYVRYAVVRFLTGVSVAVHTIFTSLIPVSIFLPPTALLLPAVSTARESPRWLVAKGRLDAAEAVMTQAVKSQSTISLLVICTLPRTTVVEQARMLARRASDSTGMSMGHTKRTLEQRILGKNS